MAINFPDSPTLNQTYTVGSVTWKWDGTTWTAVTLTTHASTHTSGGSDAVTLAQSQITNLVSDLALKATNTDLALKAPLASPTFTGTVTMPSSVDILGGHMTSDSDWTTAQLEVQASSTGSPGIAMHAPGASTGNLRHIRGTQTVTVSGNAGFIDTGANKSIRNIFVNTADPSGGVDGDVWLKYTP